jgi:3-hydroxy-9,10-secoandrosta-1,3,5(10)-triene-9,17-dione monooxygenase reductase component
VDGVTIHSSDPFATPEDAKSPVRRLRGRLPAAVTLWTAYDHEARRVGLTVSSTIVVDGSPGRVLGVLDEESALWDALRRTGRFTVIPLREADGRLADTFAGLAPAPGGPFAVGDWRDTGSGPVPAAAGTWAGCRLDDARPMGWGLLIEATMEHVEIDSDGDPAPLIHYRGRYVATR